MSEHILTTAQQVAARRAWLLRSSNTEAAVKVALELVLIEFAVCLGLPEDDEPQDEL